MVARTPPKQRREMAAAVEAPPHLDPTLLRENVKKVDECMVRLQELQYTISGISVRCKQESIKMKNGNPQRSSSSGNLPIYTEEWRRMSLPAMLLGETVGEIVKATRNIVQATTSHDDPTTPEKMVKQSMEHCQLHERRKIEKQRATRSQSDTSPSSSSSQRAKSRINFKFETEKYCSSRYIANRVSPRNRPWARKTVLFPNPLFQSSPVIARNRQKFLIKPAATSLANKSQRAAAVLTRSFSPSRLAKRFVSPLNIRNGDGDASLTAGKMRRSFSPSMVVTGLVSPLKGRRYVQKNGAENVMMGLKQGPASSEEREMSER